MKKKMGSADLMGDIAFAMTEYGPDFMHFFAKPISAVRAVTDYVTHLHAVKNKKELAKFGIDAAQLKVFRQLNKHVEELVKIYNEWGDAVDRVSGGKYPQQIAEIPKEKILAVKREIGRQVIECIRKMKPVLNRMNASMERMGKTRKGKAYRDAYTFLSMLGEIVSSFERMQASFGKVQRFADVNRVVRETIQATAVFRQRRRATTMQRMRIGVETGLAKKLPKTAVDPLTLMNALTNVFSNAQKAMGDKGTMHVKTHATKRNVFVRVRDTGRGIPPNERKAIMQWGYGIHTGRFPDVRGWGTGLKLSRTMLKAQGGDLTIPRTSTRGPNKGTTIQLRLPIKRKPVRRLA